MKMKTNDDCDKARLLKRWRWWLRNGNVKKKDGRRWGERLMRPPAVLLSVFLPIYHHHHRHHHHHRYPHHHHHCQHPLQWAFEIFTWPTPQYSKLILEVSTIFAKWIKQAAIWGYFFSCSQPACSPSFSHCCAIVCHFDIIVIMFSLGATF